MQWPDHIKNSIFWYLWKLKIKDVNRQYSDKFKDNTKYDYHDFRHDGNDYKIQINNNYRINFRMMISFGHIFEIYKGATKHYIPMKYWFSSGLNNLNGYK
jgi:hypothetical protein